MLLFRLQSHQFHSLGLRYSTSLSPAPILRSLITTEDMNSARDWIQAFQKIKSDDLPRESLQISYSRSGGAG